VKELMSNIQTPSYLTAMIIMLVSIFKDSESDSVLRTQNTVQGAEQEQAFGKHSYE
jgi:hypothetical protein